MRLLPAPEQILYQNACSLPLHEVQQRTETQFCFVRDDKHQKKTHLETDGLTRAVKWKAPEDLDLDPESRANL